MNFNIIRPSAILAPFIRQYWTMSNCQNSSSPHIQRIIPNGFIEIIFYQDIIPLYVRKNNLFSGSSFVNGQQDEFYDISISGNLNLISIMINPWAAKLFFDFPVNELFNQSVPAQLVFKSFITEVENKLNDCLNIQQKIKVIETFLIKLLIKNQNTDTKRIVNTITEINRNKGLSNVENLSSVACLSVKQFERKFIEYVGLSPKKFQRVVRFQNCLHKMQTKPEKNLTALAYNCGYFDQSHMINDFKSLTGLTPKQYFAECEPVSDYFSF